MYKVLISELAEIDDFQIPGISFVHDINVYLDMDKLVDTCADCDALLIRNQTRLMDDFFARITEMPKLKVIGRLGAGLDNIDLEAAKDAGVHVVFTPEANTEATAQYCFAAALSAIRFIPQSNIDVKGGGWDRAYTGRDFRELTFGVIGYGRIGKRFSELVRALGVSVVAWSRSEKPAEDGVKFMALEEVCKCADVLSLNVALNDETHHLVDMKFLNTMKETAILINAARGGVVNELDLVSFLKETPSFTAVLDVRDREPPMDSLFSDVPNAILTAHIGAFTHEAIKLVNKTVASDVAAILNGDSPRFPAF